VSEENDPFEREACSEDCFKEFKDYKKRGYNLLGFEDKDFQGLKLKQFVNLNLQTTWVDLKKIVPWQNAYADEVHTEDLYDFSQSKKENFNNRSQATTKTPEQSDKKSYPLKNEGGGNIFSTNKIDFFDSPTNPTGYGVISEDEHSARHHGYSHLHGPGDRLAFPDHISGMSAGEISSEFVGMGGFKVFFEKLGFNTKSPENEIEASTDSSYSEFVSSAPTTYITRGGDRTNEGGIRFITPKGDPIASIDGITLTSYVPVYVDSKPSNFHIRGRKMVREITGDANLGDRRPLVECVRSSNKKAFTVYSNEDTCNYIVDKLFSKDSDDLIKVEDYINT
jgi:hypothetical protein